MIKNRILIVDDEDDINLLFKMVLEDNGFKVDTFNDPLVALQNFTAGSYDLLILDIMMPKMNVMLFVKMMSSSPTASPENYPPMPFYHKEILNIAEELYDQLLKIVVNNTIYLLSHSANQQPNVIKTKN
jgi:CheY-like chemotaxis protein